MKVLIVLIILVMQQSAFAFLTSDQQIQVVQQLNDICGDAWCESSVDFVFQKIGCSSEHSDCVLQFTTQGNFSPDQPIENGQCLLTQIQSHEQLFDYINSVHSKTPLSFLKSSFIDQVSRCLSDYIR